MRATENDKVADAIDHVLHELQAARRDLRMTGFCLQWVIFAENPAGELSRMS